MLNSLKAVDLYRRIGSDIQQSTVPGGILSVISISVMVFLLFSEIFSYKYPNQRSTLEVEHLSQDHYMLISVNISFYGLPCNSLITYWVDSMNQHFTFYGLTRTVLDKDKNIIEHLPSFVVEDTREEGCGSCYGADSYPNQCCNTCGEVMEAYSKKHWRLPQFADIGYCTKFLNRDATKGPGCMLTGDLKMKKIAGSLHFANTLPFDVHSHWNNGLNGAHQVNHFSFRDPQYLVQEVKGPVDGNKVDNGMMTNYYFKVMSAVDKNGRFYQSSSNYLIFDRHVNPEILFNFDIEPMTTIIDDDGKNFTEFIVSVCAIIGGWYAITLLVAKIFIK